MPPTFRTPLSLTRVAGLLPDNFQLGINSEITAGRTILMPNLFDNLRNLLSDTGDNASFEESKDITRGEP